MRLARKQRYISADIQVPESVWRPKNEAELKVYLAGQVGTAMKVLLERLQRESIPIDVDALLAEFEAAVREFVKG